MPGDFTDLIAWQEASVLQGEIHRLADKLRGPGAYRAADQMRRAAESIPANIAEGYGRRTAGDFARFLRVAAASGAELENHVRSAVINRRVAQVEIVKPLARTRRVRALIRGLENWVLRREEKRRAEQQDAKELQKQRHGRKRP